MKKTIGFREVRMREEAEEKQPVVLIRMFGALQVSAKVTLEGTSLPLQLKLPLPFLPTVVYRKMGGEIHFLSSSLLVL